MMMARSGSLSGVTGAAEAVTWGRLVRNARVASRTTAKVVTFDTAPPVEVAPAPMNISIIMNSRRPVPSGRYPPC